MAVLGALNIPLSVTTSGMSKGFARGRKEINSFVGMFSSVQGALAGIGLGLSAAGLTSFVSKQMEAMDVSAKLSDRLGIQSEKLGGLQHAAGLAGISGDELAGSFSKLQKSIGEAQDVSTPAANAFQALGLNAAEMANIPLDESFTKIAQKISELPNPVDKAQMALALFGKSGQQLLPLLNSGAEGIKAAQKEAERLGITFSRIDAAKVEAANDAMTRAGAAVTGLGQKLAIGLSPYIEAAALKFSDMASNGVGATKGISEGLQFATNLIAKMADVVDTVRIAWEGVQGATSKALSVAAKFHPAHLLKSAPGGIMGMMAKSIWGGTIENVTDTIDNFSDEAGANAAKHFAAMEKKLAAPNSGDSIKAFFDSIDVSAQKAATGIATAAAKTGDFTNAFQEAENAQKAMLETQNRMKQIFEQTRTPAEKYAETLNELIDLQAAGLDEDTFQRALKQADEQLGITEKGTGANASPAGGIAAAQKGSAAAFSSLQASMREGANDPAKKTAANTQLIASNSTRQTEYLRTMAQNGPEVVEDF